MLIRFVFITALVAVANIVQAQDYVYEYNLDDEFKMLAVAASLDGDAGMGDS